MSIGIMGFDGWADNVSPLVRDRRLLRRYVREGADDAFHELVQRHSRLVYSTCLRELGDSGLAEDATQVVFLILARKAPSLLLGHSLASWLFVTARLTAVDFRRREERRRKHETELEAADTRGMVYEDRSWQFIDPHLNDALAALGTTDREAVLLRFFEQLQFKEIGLRLAVSEPAAERRVARALDKLRRHMAKAGFAVSVSTLGALLFEHAGHTVPVDLLAALNVAIVSPQTLSAATIAKSTTIADHMSRTARVLWLKAAGATAGYVVLLIVAHSYSARHASTLDTPLDESRSARRPIAYPLLEPACLNAPSMGLYASSERGRLTVRALKPDLDLSYLAHSNTVSVPTVVADLSTVPLPDRGNPIWHGDLYKHKATFRYRTWRTGIELYSGSQRIWRFQAPLPSIVLKISADRKAALLDTAGRTLWSGIAGDQTGNISITNAHNTVEIQAAALVVSIDANRSTTLSADDHVLWTGPAGSVSTAEIVEPNSDRIVGTAGTIGDRPAFVAWTPNRTATVTATAEHGSVTIKPSTGSMGGAKMVDIGHIHVHTAGRDDMNSTPLITPVAPEYVDGEVLQATYSNSTGLPVCTEAIEYDGGNNPYHNAPTVTRTLRWKNPRGSSAIASSYAAPSEPFSRVWNW